MAATGNLATQEVQHLELALENLAARLPGPPPLVEAAQQVEVANSPRFAEEVAMAFSLHHQTFFLRNSEGIVFESNIFCIFIILWISCLARWFVLDGALRVGAYFFDRILFHFTNLDSQRSSSARAAAERSRAPRVR